jgi:hypothetical protein
MGPFDTTLCATLARLIIKLYQTVIKNSSSSRALEKLELFLCCEPEHKKYGFY